MKRLLLLIGLFPAFCYGQDVLQDFFQKLETQTLESAFSVTIQENASQPMTYNGTIVMRGEQFKATIMGMEIAYDGKTLYTYSEDTDELTLSTPTKEELTEANPLLYAKALQQVCDVLVNNRGEQWQVLLTPQDKSAGVLSFTLTLRKSDLMPLSAEMKESVTRRTTLRLQNPRFTSSLPSFTLQKEGAFLNDLR